MAVINILKGDCSHKSFWETTLPAFLALTHTPQSELMTGVVKLYLQVASGKYANDCSCDWLLAKQEMGEKGPKESHNIQSFSQVAVSPFETSMSDLARSE